MIVDVLVVMLVIHGGRTTIDPFLPDSCSFRINRTWSKHAGVWHFTPPNSLVSLVPLVWFVFILHQPTLEICAAPFSWYGSQELWIYVTNCTRNAVRLVEFVRVIRIWLSRETINNSLLAFPGKIFETKSDSFSQLWWPTILDTFSLIPYDWPSWKITEDM